MFSFGPSHWLHCHHRGTLSQSSSLLLTLGNVLLCLPLLHKLLPFLQPHLQLLGSGKWPCTAGEGNGFPIMVPSLYQHILQDCGINLILRPEWLEYGCILDNRVLPTPADMRSDIVKEWLLIHCLLLLGKPYGMLRTKVLNRDRFLLWFFWSN